MGGATLDLDSLITSVRGVVFDKDGTLADLDARWVPFFRRGIDDLASACGDPSLAPALSAALGVDETALVPDGPAAVETPARIVECVIEALVERGHDPKRVDVFVAAAEAGDTFGPLRPLGDVVGALRHLCDRGVLLVVATSDGRANTIDELAELGVTALLPTIRCGDDGGAVKPDPAVLLGIADEWGIAPGMLLFVGDSRADLETARGAGSPFVARCHPERVPGWAVEADAVVADIGELVVR